MTHATRRWSLLIAFWIVQTTLLYTLYTVWSHFGGWARGLQGDHLGPLLDDWLDGFRFEEESWVLAGAVALSVLQAVFVWPVRRPRIEPGPGPSALASLGAAGVFIAVLVTAAVIAIAEFASPEDVLFGQPFPPPSWVLWGTLAVSWLIATPLLIAFCRKGPRDRVLQRIAAWLFIGTIVEAAAVIPLDVLVRRRDQCHCATGTFWALTLCGSLGLIVLGPAIFIPIYARRRKRWYAGRCEVCGYSMRGLKDAQRCPECGAGWRPDTAQTEIRTPEIP